MAVVNMGSRSSEAVILGVTDGLIEEKGGASDHLLGGERIDDALLAWCIKVEPLPPWRKSRCKQLRNQRQALRNLLQAAAKSEYRQPRNQYKHCEIKGTNSSVPVANCAEQQMARV